MFAKIHSILQSAHCLPPIPPPPNSTGSVERRHRNSEDTCRTIVLIRTSFTNDRYVARLAYKHFDYQTRKDQISQIPAACGIGSKYNKIVTSTFGRLSGFSTTVYYSFLK